MTTLPKEVTAVLDRNSFEQRHGALLVVDEEGRLLRSSGQLSTYGLSRLRPGEDVIGTAPFLVGLLPLVGDAVELPRVNLGRGTAADVYVVGTPAGTWVVLMDASTEAGRQQRLQQQANEARLRTETARSAARADTRGTANGRSAGEDDMAP